MAVVERQLRGLLHVADVVDREHVGVRERRRRARLVEQALGAVGAGAALDPEDLQRHLAGKLGVVCAVDLAHAAGAQELDHLVPVDAVTGAQAHFLLP